MWKAYCASYAPSNDIKVSPPVTSYKHRGTLSVGKGNYYSNLDLKMLNSSCSSALRLSRMAFMKSLAAMRTC